MPDIPQPPLIDAWSPSQRDLERAGARPRQRYYYDPQMQAHFYQLSATRPDGRQAANTVVVADVETRRCAGPELARRMVETRLEMAWMQIKRIVELAGGDGE